MTKCEKGPIVTGFPLIGPVLAVGLPRRFYWIAISKKERVCSSLSECLLSPGTVRHATAVMKVLMIRIVAEWVIGREGRYRIRVVSESKILFLSNPNPFLDPNNVLTRSWTTFL